MCYCHSPIMPPLAANRGPFCRHSRPPQIIMNAFSRLSAVPHRMHNEARAPHVIATCKYCGHAGHLVGIDFDCSPFVERDFPQIASLWKGNWIKTVSNEQDIGAHHKIRASNGAGLSSSGAVRFSQFHADAPHASYISRSIPLQRRRIYQEKKTRAFLERVAVLFSAAGHIGEVTTVDAGGLNCAATNRRAQTI